MGLLGGLLSIGASIIGGNSQKKAADAAAKAQQQSAQLGMTALNQQYDWAKGEAAPWTVGGAGAQQELLNLLGIATPATKGATDWAAYVQGNPDALANWNSLTPALKAQFGNDIAQFGEYHYNLDGARRDLTPFQTGGTAGTNGDASAAIEALKASPVYQALFKNGVDTTLANASATGGLRGGNTQDALARVGTDTLAKVYNDRIGQLGAVSNTGLSAVTGLEDLGASNAGAIAALFGKQGDAAAGASLAKGAINASMAKNIAGGLSDIGSSIKGIGKLF